MELPRFLPGSFFRRTAITNCSAFYIQNRVRHRRYKGLLRQDHYHSAVVHDLGAALVSPVLVRARAHVLAAPRMVPVLRGMAHLISPSAAGQRQRRLVAARLHGHHCAGQGRDRGVGCFVFADEEGVCCAAERTAGHGRSGNASGENRVEREQKGFMMYVLPKDWTDTEASPTIPALMIFAMNCCCCCCCFHGCGYASNNKLWLWHLSLINFDAKVFHGLLRKGKLDSATRSEMTLGRVLGLALGNTLTLATTEGKRLLKLRKCP